MESLHAPPVAGFGYRCIRALHKQGLQGNRVPTVEKNTRLMFEARSADKLGRGLSPVPVSTYASIIIKSKPANLDRVVHLEPQERVAIKDPVLQTALRKGWIPAEFVRLLGSGNAGTSLLWTADRRSKCWVSGCTLVKVI